MTSALARLWRWYWSRLSQSPIQKPLSTITMDRGLTFICLRGSGRRSITRPWRRFALTNNEFAREITVWLLVDDVKPTGWSHSDAAVQSSCELGDEIFVI